MDDLVRQALARWPDVPDCYGWLMLDARGRWRIGVERQTISHAPMNAFISRNVVADAAGRYAFQNGPQRVWIAFEITPWVWRLVPDAAGVPQAQDHTGTTARHVTEAWLTDAGAFLLVADGRAGVVHDHDVPQVIEHLCAADGTALNEDEVAARILRLQEGHADAGVALALPGQARIPLRPIADADVPAHFGFIRTPTPATP